MMEALNLIHIRDHLLDDEILKGGLNWTKQYVVSRLRRARAANHCVYPRSPELPLRVDLKAEWARFLGWKEPDLRVIQMCAAIELVRLIR